MQVHEYFRLEEKCALEIIQEVKKAIQQWRKIAAKYGISRTEQELMKMAFRISET